MILKKAINQILWSWYENPRQMKLILYYPGDEAVAALMTTEELLFSDEIDCSDLFGSDNPRERILVFETVCDGR